MSQAFLYPQQYIGKIVAEAVGELYAGVEPDIRTVRQTKHRQFGSLQYIDYAVPCFEIANEVHQSPFKVAERLATALQSQKQVKFIVEPVAGYLNFQITEAYFAKALQETTQWLESPESTRDGRVNEFLIVGHSIPEDTPPTLNDVFYQYIQGLANVMGKAVRTQYLISDNSEQLVGYVKSLARTETAAKQVNGASVATKTALNISDLIDSVRSEWLAKHQTTLKQYHSDSCEVIAESSLQTSVSNYISQLIGDSDRQGVIKDAATGAAYYLLDEEATPLRSMKGFQFRMAYVLYLLEQRLTKLAAKKTSLVVVAPQSMHALIYDRVATLAGGNLGNVAVTCFDPQVSRADIMEIQEFIPSIRDHFAKIATTLAKLDVDKLQDFDIRTSALSIIDAPVELSESLTASRLPQLFDCLNQTNGAARVLAR